MSTLAVGTIKSISSAAPVFQNTSGTEKGQLVKAWINFNGTGTAAINDDFNISSITDNGTGDFTINFSNVLSNANYAVVACNGRQTSGNSTNAFCLIVAEETTAKTTGLFRIISLGTNTYFNLVDPNSANIAVFGDS